MTAKKIGNVISYALILFIFCCSNKASSLPRKYEISRVNLENPLVILLTIDSFRSSNISGLGYKKKTTPFLDRFIDNGIVFRNSYTACAWTIPSLISILTGLPSTSHGVWTRGWCLSRHVLTLPDILKKDGYHVPDICYLTSDPMFGNIGLESFMGREIYIAHGDTALLEMLEEYKKNPRATFLFYHNRTLHLPYNSADEYLKQFLPETEPDSLTKENLKFLKEQAIIDKGTYIFGDLEKQIIEANYNGALHQIDFSLIKPLWEILQTEPFRNNVILIISTDHGEELFEHGWIGHASTSLSGQVYEEVIKIPLIIYAPSFFKKKAEINELVSTLDIMPTILDLAGIELPSSIMGESLLPVICGEKRKGHIVCETTVGGYRAEEKESSVIIQVLIYQGWKIIKRVSGNNVSWCLYDLNKDKMEKNDLSETSTAKLNELKSIFNSWSKEAFSKSIKPEKEEKIQAIEDGKIQIMSPADKDILYYDKQKSVVSLKWTGGSGRIIVEYDIGEKHKKLNGIFPADNFMRVFGPLSLQNWKMLKSFNPFKIRVIDKETHSASYWITFKFEI
ncbi:MAG: sulfatase [Candidatus Coatesbacteria bacterium]|nr:sulfatase [Candidatus Coatesbacteria bacterium]